MYRLIIYSWIFAVGVVLGNFWGVQKTERLHEEWIREYNLDRYDMRDKIGEVK
jgi:hypothetical protein